jgi:hypothetical protein
MGEASNSLASAYAVLFPQERDDVFLLAQDSIAEGPDEPLEQNQLLSIFLSAPSDLSCGQLLSDLWRRAPKSLFSAWMSGTRGVGAGRRRSCPRPFSLATSSRVAAESHADKGLVRDVEGEALRRDQERTFWVTGDSSDVSYRP